MAGAVMDALSVRGQSISSGGSGESKASSNLARDLSLRSENVVPHGAVASHSARILTARSNTTRTKSKGEGRLFYVGHRGHFVFIRVEVVLRIALLPDKELRIRNVFICRFQGCSTTLHATPLVSGVSKVRS